MRKIAATYIFPGDKPPVKNGILICEQDGTIAEIRENNSDLREEAGLEYYSGILTPGFVNTHCHLELSHLKGKITNQAGIGAFLQKINQFRNLGKEERLRAIQIYDRKMWAAGIAAVGDVSNSSISLATKQKSPVFYHTFVESFGFHPSRANKSYAIAQAVYSEFDQNNLSASIVPHSPYSVSELLFEKIKTNALQTKSILSIHNQESAAEDEFFKKGTGPIANHLQDNLALDISHWEKTEISSLVFLLKKLPTQNQLLLVHNTHTKGEDITELSKTRNPKNTYFVLCPNSNLNIENRLPPVSLFRNENLNICIGTDSLASNDSLSLLSEMLTLQQHFPEIELEELIKWATIKGAEALNIENSFGSFEVGKKPGVNLITGIDYHKMRITPGSKVKRLV